MSVSSPLWANVAMKIARRPFSLQCCYIIAIHSLSTYSKTQENLLPTQLDSRQSRMTHEHKALNPCIHALSDKPHFKCSRGTPGSWDSRLWALGWRCPQWIVCHVHGCKLICQTCRFIGIKTWTIMMCSCGERHRSCQTNVILAKLSQSLQL